MIIVGMLSWWYTLGWKKMTTHSLESIERLYDKFSLGLLIKTLFAPWRQISAGSVRGPIGVQIRAFFDRLISRIVGGAIRTGTLLVGIVALIISGILAIIKIVAWPVIPALPVVFCVLAMIGWVPWQL